MNSDFFGFDGETAVESQQFGSGHFQSQDNAPDDQFQFSQPSNYVAIEYAQQPAYSGIPTDKQALLRIQQEQTRIQDLLREKANREYEQKQKRKEEGRRQLEEFLSKKQTETQARRQQNMEKEKELLARNQKLSQQAGWKKVAANVPLKQGEHKGAKDTNRMRESIINKRNDQAQ